MAVSVAIMWACALACRPATGPDPACSTWSVLAPSEPSGSSWQTVTDPAPVPRDVMERLIDRWEVPDCSEAHTVDAFIRE